MIKKIIQQIFFVCAVTFFAACNTNDSGMQSKVDALQKKVDEYEQERKTTSERIAVLDTLDFNYYSNKNWNKFAESHTADIKVFYPDGRTTDKLFPDHIDIAGELSAFAPDNTIKVHPITFGSGDYSAMIGEINGTFTKPLDMGNGTIIQPTGKPFKLTMCTISHWKAGKMDSEYLFWDNLSVMKQIGAMK